MTKSSIQWNISCDGVCRAKMLSGATMTKSVNKWQHRLSSEFVRYIDNIEIVNVFKFHALTTMKMQWKMVCSYASTKCGHRKRFVDFVENLFKKFETVLQNATMTANYFQF